MKLHDLIESYIAHQRSLGMRFRSDANLLRAFCRAMGEIAIEDVGPDAVLEFIAGTGPITAFWFQKFKVIGSFYRYALGRGLATVSPLPTTVPQVPPPLTPYIYSIDELKRLLAATDTLEAPNSRLQAVTMRVLLLTLYGTGMRIGEALSLTLHDVDLRQGMLTVRDGKFYKARLIPIGPRLVSVLVDFARRRRQLPLPAGEESPFFATRTGKRCHHRNINRLFCRIRKAAIRREDDARYQPRIHDIRHTAVVHRVIAWYRNGSDVQRLLPQLATYLGHVDVASTQHYLSITPEMLREASRHFEHYAQSEVRDA
jgi:integrase/recombinase XerD